MISDSEFCALQFEVKKNNTSEVLNLALFTYLSRRLLGQCGTHYGVSFSAQLLAHDRCVQARMIELDGSLQDVEDAIAEIERAGQVVDYLRSLPN